MTEVILKHRAARAGETGLFAVDEQGSEVLHKIKLGSDVGCDVKRRRHPRHHRLYWKIIQFIQLHCPLFENVPLDKIHVALKVATGLVDTTINIETGEPFYVLRSIAWGAMDQSEFEPWFNDAVNVIAKRWMPPGTTAESVRAELLAMIDGPGKVGSKVA
jgi:hypothetical protein